VKYRVHRCARGRCERCGAHEHQRALEVDHIVPSNQGGSDDLSNLQGLCFRCNAGKLIREHSEPQEQARRLGQEPWDGFERKG
jgi:5-methylcytosine-specific restriction endonuclease McrA